MLDLSQFYNNVKLIHTKTEIDRFNDIYVANYTKVQSFEELRSKFPVNLHPIVEHEYQKQYNAQKGIQGGVVVELVVLATIAKIFNIDSFSYENGQYIYENDEYRFTLQGNMGHGQNTNKTGNDILILEKNTNKIFNCEVKEPFARLNEMDWNYDEDGHLCPTPQAKAEKVALFQPIADAYNKRMSVFEHIGHNFPLTPEMVQDVIEDYFKNIDYVLTYDEKTTYLLVIPHDPNLFNLIYTNKGSEIRGASGKNPKVIFTKQYSEKVLNKYLIKEENGYYYFNIKDFVAASARQSASGRRYRLAEGFTIRSGDAIVEGDIVKCRIKDFKQNSAVISPKIKLIASYDKIKQIILEGGYNIDK